MCIGLSKICKIVKDILPVLKNDIVLLITKLRTTKLDDFICIIDIRCVGVISTTIHDVLHTVALFSNCCFQLCPPVATFSSQEDSESSLDTYPLPSLSSEVQHFSWKSWLKLKNFHSLILSFLTKFHFLTFVKFHSPYSPPIDSL